MTPTQKATLKTFILATSDLNTLYTDGNLDGLRDALNAVASPDFWVWRTNVTRAEIYHTTSVDSTTWNWTTYKNQGVAEQNAWTQMFMNDQANFGLANLRAGVGAIFTGSAQANAQRDHILSIAKRLSSRFERVFAVGTGSSAVPATILVEGPITTSELIGL